MKAEPYTDVATHVRDELRRAWLRVEYQVRIGWRSQLPFDHRVHTQDPITPMDMGELFAEARGVRANDANGADELLAQWLAAHEHVEGRIRATREASVRSPLVDLI